MRLLFFSIVLLLAVSSCKQKPAQMMQQDNWDKQNIRVVDISDTAYRHAVKVAQENIDLFVKLLKEKKNNNVQYYIKSRFTQGVQVEHMWLVAEDIDNNSFSATLDNVPNKLTTIKYKDKVKVAKEDVEDWIVYEGDSVLLGNFISYAILK
jgi:uncharacterized protein YegJ (DUF2314 family)